jgi:hypothetical protein
MSEQSQPSLCIGEIDAQWIAKYEAELPPIEELLKDLDYLNILCTP